MVEHLGSPHPAPLPEGEGETGEGASKQRLCSRKFSLQGLAHLL
jgi:hypothetical protein